MRIVQIAPQIRPGSGRAGVAWSLEQAFRARGIQVESFTAATARRHPRRFIPRHRMTVKLSRAWQIIWFSTIGTRRARRYLEERPDAASICHGDVMAGDIYVDHGMLLDTSRTRGGRFSRMLRNPALLFIHFRDRTRFRGTAHRAIVVLSSLQAATLAHTYGPVGPRLEVISNGVDLDRFRPATAAERSHARSSFHLDDDARVALFVGHDVVRKGLIHAVRALVHAPSVLLLVVGGDAEGIDAARTVARESGVEPRVLFAGTRFDLALFFAASDMFVFPSSYEANALVLLESLASGLPVVSTRVGYAPELIEDGVNGYLVAQDPAEIGARLEQLAAADLFGWRDRARTSAMEYSWHEIAGRYLDLLETTR